MDSFGISQAKLDVVEVKHFGGLGSGDVALLQLAGNSVSARALNITENFNEIGDGCYHIQDISMHLRNFEDLIKELSDFVMLPKHVCGGWQHIDWPTRLTDSMNAILPGRERAGFAISRLMVREAKQACPMEHVERTRGLRYSTGASPSADAPCATGPGVECNGQSPGMKNASQHVPVPGMEEVTQSASVPVPIIVDAAQPVPMPHTWPVPMAAPRGSPVPLLAVSHGPLVTLMTPEATSCSWPMTHEASLLASQTPTFPVPSVVAKLAPVTTLSSHHLLMSVVIQVPVPVGIPIRLGHGTLGRRQSGCSPVPQHLTSNCMETKNSKSYITLNISTAFKMEEQCYYNETIAFFYNQSGKYLATEWNTVSKLVMGLGITVCIFIMLANLLVMVAIYINRRFHFPIYYLMANLAAADFFAGLAYFYLMFNTGPNTRRLTVSTWLLRQGLIDTSLTASVANLLAIAIERHITVFRMQLHTRMSNRRVVVVIVIIWTMSIVMGAIPSVGWNCICAIRSCSSMAPLYSNSYLVFWAVFNLVTFVVMVVLYAHIFMYVRQRTMRMSRHSSGQRRNRDTMMSLLKTVVIVLGAFIVCWTPGLVLLLLDVFCPKCDVLAYEKFFLLLAEFNSAMNPIIYSYRDKEMSVTFRRILCCQRQENANGTAEGSDRSASSFNHTVLSSPHNNDHSVV
ncbi:hypothetical protein P4O66_005789 [Electrophorus voltai]|nr:hypothetical protein P4O66_005789 [Electrophorus voltai]